MRKFILLAALIASAAYADPSAHEKLDQAQKKLTEERAHAQEIAKERAQAQEELKKSRENLVHIASDVQKSESQLSDAQDKLAILSHERQERAAELESRRAALNSMVAAAIRLSQAPPEAAVMMPGDVSDALTAAHVLSDLAHSIRKESENIGAQVRELDKLTTKVERTRHRAAQVQNELKGQRMALQEHLNERQALDAQLSREQETTKKRLEDLSRQAKNLQDLMSKIESARAAIPPGAHKGKVRAITSARGALRMPVSGRITQRFGEGLGKNETSKGLIISTPQSASVVAPFDGEVVFTGPFLDYGNMVILRHSDDFHTLLAGFNRINVTPGEFLLEGEPIGAMGDSSAETGLYVELRQHNQPIDPAPWLRSSH